MKSRIIRTVITLLAPLVIEYVIKKVSEKLDKKSDSGPKVAEPLGHS